MLSFLVSSTAKASVRPIRNKSTVPVTRRNILSKADCPSKGPRRPAGQQLIRHFHSHFIKSLAFCFANLTARAQGGRQGYEPTPRRFRTPRPHHMPLFVYA